MRTVSIEPSTPSQPLPHADWFARLTDFYAWLQAFFGIFSELARKDLYLTGESYAGFYIPYIATRILDASPVEKANLPLNLRGLVCVSLLAPRPPHLTLTTQHQRRRVLF